MNIQKRHLFKCFKPLSGSLSYLVLKIIEITIFKLNGPCPISQVSVSYDRIIKYM